MPTLATDAISLHVDPQRGGKITSLRDHRSGRRWLLEPREPYGSPAGYGADFVAVELAGWDEMAPTIVAGRLEVPPIDVALPDHGELWSVAWETREVDDERIVLRGTGRVLPYALERTVEVVGADRVRLAYRLENRGELAFPVLWAAHPQLRWRAGGRVELPAQVTEVLDVTSAPLPRTVAWDVHEAARLEHLTPGQGHKVWTLPEERAAWCRLRDPDGGSLTFHVDPTRVPYFGIWWDAGAYAPVPVVAIEPATGHFDALATAVATERVPWLSPGATQRWELELHLDAGDRR